MTIRKYISSTILCAGFVIGTFGAVASSADLTVVSWGGAYTKSQIEAYHKPFMAKTGNKLVSEDYGGGTAEIKAQVEAGNVTWDVVDVELSDAISACDEGLLEVIDHSSLPAGADGTSAKDDFIPGTLQECAVGTIFWSTVYGYDKSKMGSNPPKTMKDYFDTSKFPGKRGMRKNPKPNLEFALVADGVPAKDVYKVLNTPAGVDRAFAKLDTIKDDILWWTAGAQPPQMLADGEVVMTTAYNGRLFAAFAEEDKPFEIVWDGQVYDMDLWVVLKGSKNREAALDFVKFSTDTQRLADQASYISYSPARKSSVPKIGKYHNKDISMADHMPNAPKNSKNAVLIDSEFWADNANQLNERFNAWLAN